MRRALLVSAALLLPPLALVSARGGELARNVIKPYAFQPPPSAPANPLQDQMGRSYRDQLRSRLREEQQQNLGLDATGARQLRDTQSELQRMNRFLEQPAVPLPGPVAPPNPAIAQQPVPRRNPLDLDAANPPGAGAFRGGGHQQPTPAEIDALQKAQRRPPPAPPLPPVHDFYGNPM